MIKQNKIILISTLLLTPILSAQAGQPDADTLIGHFYGGIHGAYLKADNDRLEYIDDKFNNGYGLGLEGGYRLSAPVELRLSYSNFKADLHKGDDVDGIDKYSLDALYFPTHKNVYLLGGLNGLDYDSDVETALNLGLGYRHHFTERFAGYVEGKANYQFDDNYTDGIAQLGLIYFFGSNTKSEPVYTEPVVAVVAVEKIIDLDNDGIADSDDQCLTTPENDKVDETGCTIFDEQQKSHRLSVYFDSNESVVKPEYYEGVEKASDFLKKYPHVNITVDGYSSTKGNADYNKKLSQQRADAIASLLTTKYGIDTNRITPIGHGEENLIDTADTPKAHKTNRRIELNMDTTDK